MNIFHRFANTLRGLKQRRGPVATRRRLWNREFSSGRWNTIKQTPNDPVYAYVEKYCRGGSVLDLGCGTGNTGCELATECYQNYTGVDISDVALDMAQHWSAQCGRGEKNHYIQADLAAYVPADQYDVILFRESIYYLPPRQIQATLERYARFLKQDGMLILRLHHVSVASHLEKYIGRQLTLVEQFTAGHNGPVIKVFRPTNRCQPTTVSRL